MVTPEDLAKIPARDRHVIALWLTERAAQMQRSWVSKQFAGIGAEALWGAAADLIDPLCEDSTVSYAYAVLRDAGAMLGDDADTTPEPR
jgi:hypothetical protein